MWTVSVGPGATSTTGGRRPGIVLAGPGGLYPQGLRLGGRRKSIQSTAARIAELVDEAVAWAIDDTGLLTCGAASPCVARLYTGAVGSDQLPDRGQRQHGHRHRRVWCTGGCRPRVMGPGLAQSRRKAGISEETGHRGRWRLALDMRGELVSRGGGRR
ncbi:transposase [Phytohabitans aurantiacus]|uniref:transposase n=1 Tax=Phytohabitans aurantiacus TaxID=3016789 RepID=UPI003899EE96